jgi:2-polyprenyl-3-methyl-5-hydroxy-6-metoxy-1,4-benzoquinol methylase
VNTKESIINAFNRASDNYAASYWNELDKKPFDQILLKWFANQIPAGELILEIGAGPGEVSGYLSTLGVKCLATDASEKMIENGKKLLYDILIKTQNTRVKELILW